MKKGIILILATLWAVFFVTAAYAGNIVVRTVNVGMSGSKDDSATVYESFPVCYSTDVYDISYTQTTSYEIDTSLTQFSPSFESWTAGKAVTVQVTIVPKEGYRFDKQDTVVNVIGKNTSLTEKSILSNRIKLKLKYWPSIVLPCIDPSTVELDEHNEYKLKWKAVEVDGKPWKYYEVRVMNEGSGEKSVETRTVSTNSVDLSGLLFSEINSIAIRTVGGSVGKERYTHSSQWVVIDDSQSTDVSIKGSFSGSGDKIVYLDADGNMISGWLRVNTSWYYFDPGNKNRAVTDRFACIDGALYYFGSDSVMQMGWVQSDGYWYYMHDIIDGSEGKMETGWIKTGPGGPYYFMNDGSVQGFPTGAMVTDTVTPDGYTVDSAGKRVN